MDSGITVDDPLTLCDRVLDPLKSTAKPLACAAPNAEILMSRLATVPFCVVPLSTAAGCGCSDGGAFSASIGTIPIADKVSRDDTGIWMGIGALGGLVDSDGD